MRGSSKAALEGGGTRGRDHGNSTTVHGGRTTPVVAVLAREAELLQNGGGAAEKMDDGAVRDT